SYFQDMINSLRRFDLWSHTLPNLPCFLIFDQQFVEKYPFLRRPIGDPIPGWVTRAETPRELAHKFGIDPNGLVETIEKFNVAARRGEDPDHGRGSAAWGRSYAGDLRATVNPNLGTLERAPYYGARMLASGLPAGGLLANADGQVMHVRGRPIPRLYAS